MAFHQQARQSVPHVISQPNEERYITTTGSQATEAPLEGSQTWVLFSPSGDNTTSASDFTESEESLITPGRSRVSEVGSLGAAPGSDELVSRRSGSIQLSTTIPDEDNSEDDAELDSLDGHLPEFRVTPNPYIEPSQTPQPVLPNHDGLGSFRLDHNAAGESYQERIYAFERLNPHRIRERSGSFELAQLDADQDYLQEIEKMQRIEAWRLEQSRALLEEIQKETRRRRNSLTSIARSAAHHQRAGSSGSVGEQATQASPEDLDQGLGWHDDATTAENDEPKSSSLLQRITKTVIQGLLGIDDDRLLAILFGESSPTDDAPASQTSPPAPGQSTEHEEDWRLHFLETVARELGLLVNQLSRHPGAFSTYARVHQMPLPYAGLPAIPETTADTLLPAEEVASSHTMPDFRPTISQAAQPTVLPHTGRLSFQGDTRMADAETVGSSGSYRAAGFTQDEWEKDLDVKLVFRYIRSRFINRLAGPPVTAGTSHLATSSTQETAAKAARARQHPLVSGRMRPVERRSFKASVPTSPVAIRHASSCASQSTRRSARRSSSSSRHYWDIGGSLGTGSVIASNGPMGSWGEV